METSELMAELEKHRSSSQWQMQDALEGLVSTLKEGSVNERQALSQLDKILDTEREIQHLHVGLAERIKNKLIPEQQSKLQGLNQAARK